MSTTYYISTGAQENYFTLRMTFDEIVYSKDEAGNAFGSSVRRDYYVRNLSTDREQAIAKAREITGSALSADFEVRPFGRVAEIDWSLLQAGKHSGKSIVELAASEDGRKYLFWLCENMSHAKQYAKTVELARPYLAKEYAAKAEDQAARATAAAKVSALLSPIAELLKDGRGGFCDNVAASMIAGQIPAQGAVNIVCDILAKAQGRRGSKAYVAEFERVEAIFSSLAG